MNLGRVFKWQCFAYSGCCGFFFFKWPLLSRWTSLISTQRVWWWRRDSHLKVTGRDRTVNSLQNRWVHGRSAFVWMKGSFLFPPFKWGRTQPVPSSFKSMLKMVYGWCQSRNQKSARKWGDAVLGYSCQYGKKNFNEIKTKKNSIGKKKFNKVKMKKNSKALIKHFQALTT